MIPQRDRLYLGLIIVAIIALVKLVVWAYKVITSTG
jgi:hypothetical protein